MEVIQMQVGFYAWIWVSQKKDCATQKAQMIYQKSYTNQLQKNNKIGAFFQDSY